MSSNQLDILENILFLKKNSLFNSMNTRELKAVAAICHSHHFTKNETVVTQGEVGDTMYLIKEGEVSVMSVQDGEPVELAVLSTGESFGEMAMFDAEMRSATVIAKKECTLLSINSSDITDLLQIYPEIAIAVIKTLVKRLRGTIGQIRDLSREKL